MSEGTGVLGVLLAGGLGRRLGGGGKCLVPLGGRTLLERAISAGLITQTPGPEKSDVAPPHPAAGSCVAAY